MKTVFPQDPREMTEQQFMECYSGVYEKSPWIAAQLWQQGPDAIPRDVDCLARALAEIVDRSTPDQRLALLRAHPDLAGRAALAGELTTESRNEQAGAGLDQCTAEELARFQELNTRYTNRFGFPFIMAVKGADRHQILAGFTERVTNDRQVEFQYAIDQVHKIAKFRLQEIARHG